MQDNFLPGGRSGRIAHNAILQHAVPAVLLCCVVAALWPYLQYYVDPDAISYLNIASRYVAGDYAHAINAFWSPMGCWLTALAVKGFHWPLFQAAIMVNTLPALGMVLAGQSLFNRFRGSAWERWCFGLMSALFWSYTVYFQSFTDIWQFFFLTVGLLILLRPAFTLQPAGWVLLGMAGCLSYFGKAYSFIFYPGMIVLVTALKLWAGEGRIVWKRLILIAIASIGVMMLCAFPWLYLLHEKYHTWTYSTAGKLNMSWWLVGTQEFHEPVKALVPPPYKGSLYYFEDPYLAQGRMAHFWDSPHLFLKQLLRVGYNAIGWVESANRISAFYFVVWLLSILFLFSRKERLFAAPAMKILVVLFLVFPLPYWLLTFDGGRYLWFTIPMVSILALHLADRSFGPALGRRAYTLFVAVFFASFLIAPVADMKEMVRTGKTEYEMAQQLKQMDIKGAFIANRSYADDGPGIIRISWFSGNPWYCHTLNDFTTARLLEDAARYPEIKYYFYFYNGAGDDYVFRNLQGGAEPDLTGGRILGLKVFRIGR